MEAAIAEDAWFATGKLLDASHHDRIDGAFDAICRGACAWRCGHGRPDSALWNQPRPIRFAPLTAAVFRAELFERIGLLDETLESYLEDVDLRNPLRQKPASRAATSPKRSPTIRAALRWEAGIPDTVRRIARNQLLLVAKHYPREMDLTVRLADTRCTGVYGDLPR